MKHLKYTLAAATVLIGLFCPANPAQAGTSATVNVKITVLPYAEVTFDLASVEVKEGSPGSITGTLMCNAPVKLTAAIRAPSGAGTWTVTPAPGSAEAAPGEHSLLWTVAVTDGTGSSRTVYILRDGDLVPGNPSDGVVTVTFTVVLD